MTRVLPRQHGRSNIGQSDISPLAYAGDTYAYTRAEVAPVPMKRLRADQTPLCPPHHFLVNETRDETIEVCCKCPTVHRRSKFFGVVPLTLSPKSHNQPGWRKALAE